MKNPIFEPYAARLHWGFRQPLTGDEWGVIFAEYVEAVAQRSTQLGRIVVGHIKGIALVPGSGYVRVSLTSPFTPADVENTAPDPLAELTLDLNVLIYGLSLDQITRVAQETASRLAASRSGHVEIESVHAEHSPL